MRIGKLAAALGVVATIGSSGCLDMEEVGGLGEGEGEEIASTAAELTDVMGNTKQNGFGARTRAITSFCTSSQICGAADVNGDGRVDLFAIDPVAGRIQLARNTSVGTSISFSVVTQTHAAARASRQYGWGDVDLDGREDLFVCDQVSGAATAFRSFGSSLSTAAIPVASNFCRAGEQFRVGDVNRDGVADAVRFRMNAGGGDVMAAVSLDEMSWGAPTLWHGFFGINDEQVRLADLDGDRADDAITCVPGAGAFIALSNRSTAFFNARRPRVGIGMANTLPVLTDLALSGQTCLTGDFDGGGKHDLIVFAGGVGGFIDSFHDTRGDVYVALSHTMLDFTDFYRVGRPRIRHEDFCRAGELCEVGDLNDDGKDDLISFARGAGGTNNVHVALSNFGRATSWNLDLMTISARASEGTGDKPLVLALSFRSTVGVRGSTRITRNAYNETFATGLRPGMAPIAIPTSVGRFTMTGVRLPTVDELMTRRLPLEIVGVVVVTMEKDLSAAAAYSGLLDEATRALNEVLVAEIENKTLIQVVTGDGLLTGNMEDLGQMLGDNLESALDDIIHWFITGLFDIDDYINFNVAIFPAVDKEVGFADDDEPRVHVNVPGEGLFGILPGVMPFNDEDGPIRWDIRAMLR